MTTPIQQHPPPGMVQVHVEDSAELDRALDDAIESIKSAANQHRTGIMVTRTGPGRYIVRAHPAVPHGLIRQRHE